MEEREKEGLGDGDDLLGLGVCVCGCVVDVGDVFSGPTAGSEEGSIFLRLRGFARGIFIRAACGKLC
jgi:hypothetical protein